VSKGAALRKGPEEQLLCRTWHLLAQMHGRSAALPLHTEQLTMVALQVAGYEQLLRKVMLKAPQAALLSMACFSFKITHKGLPGAYWKTAEDMHAVISKRCGCNTAQAQPSLLRHHMLGCW
jgi:aromatic ring hydroxylase